MPEGKPGEEMPPIEFYDAMPECPACKAGGVKNSYMVNRYYTEEGKKLLEELREKIMKKHKKN